jgi:large subunit ribosomal protein L31
VKTDIHPEYITAKVTCVCGNSFETRATVPEIHLDICNVCHPFYTGKQKFVDTAGRVERFRQKYGIEEGQETVVEKKKRARKGRAQKTSLDASPKVLAERAAKKADERREQDMIKEAGRRQRAKGEPVASAGEQSAPAAPPKTETKADSKTESAENS